MEKLTVESFNRFLKELYKQPKKIKKSEPKPISEFDKVFSKMTREEQETNLQNSLCGMWCRSDGETTILMGSDAMDRYLNFQKQMIEKYS